MSAIAKTVDAEVARPLKVLVTLIKEDLENAREASERASLPYYRAAGEKMLEAKSQMPHGEFMPWVARNFKVGDRQARRYMGYAGTKTDARVQFTSLRDFERATNPNVGTGKTTWHEPVQKIVSRVDTETLNLKREELKRADERDAQRQLAVQLIDIGYKVLARKLHPDRGGSREAMARLNAVRDRLKGCA